MERHLAFEMIMEWCDLKEFTNGGASTFTNRYLNNTQFGFMTEDDIKKELDNLWDSVKNFECPIDALLLSSKDYLNKYKTEYI